MQADRHGAGAVENLRLDPQAPGRENIKTHEPVRAIFIQTYRSQGGIVYWTVGMCLGDCLKLVGVRRPSSLQVAPFPRPGPKLPGHGEVELNICGQEARMHLFISALDCMG